MERVDEEIVMLSEYRVIVGGVHVVEGSQNSVQFENLARFAVQEHNKIENSVVEFVRVISAKQQVVSGSLYFITLEAKDGVKKQNYEATIWEQPWMNFKQLQGFKLVADLDHHNAPSVSST